MGKEKKAKTDIADERHVTNFIIAILKLFGPTTLVILILGYLILFQADSDQKSEMINNWLLLKNEKHRHCVVIIVALLGCLIATVAYYKKALSLYVTNQKKK